MIALIYSPGQYQHFDVSIDQFGRPWPLPHFFPQGVKTKYPIDLILIIFKVNRNPQFTQFWRTFLMSFFGWLTTCFPLFSDSADINRPIGPMQIFVFLSRSRHWIWDTKTNSKLSSMQSHFDILTFSMSKVTKVNFGGHFKVYFWRPFLFIFYFILFFFCTVA